MVLSAGLVLMADSALADKGGGSARDLSAAA